MVLGYEEAVRVCDSCCDFLDWGSELSNDMKQKSGKTEAPWAQNSWVDKAVAYGHPLIMVEGRVEEIIQMQDNIVRLEKTIEHTIARQVECEAVLEIKVQACEEHKGGLERAQKALEGLRLQHQGDVEAPEAVGDRVLAGAQVTDGGDVDEENAGTGGVKRGIVVPAAKGRPKRAALGALSANAASPAPDGRPSRASGARSAVSPQAAATPESMPHAPWSASSLTSYNGISPIAVSWYDNSARECLQPEWVELAQVMGHSKEVVHRAYQRLLSKPVKISLDTFLAAVTELEGSDRSPEQQESDMEAAVFQVPPEQLQLEEELRARMKELADLKEAGALLEGLNGASPEVADEVLCSICLNNKSKIVFKCGHLKCEDCADELMSREQHERLCPECRQLLTSPRKVFL